MKKLTGLLVVLFSLFVMAGVANATTYYVKTAANGGNDANSGTEPSPFLTIQHAISVAVDNDQIMVNSGTYNQDGTTGPIIVPANRNGLDIIGYGPSKPVIDGSGLNTTTYQVNGFKILSDEVVINNFTIQNFIERDADINNLTQGPGAGILTGTLTSGHRFYNLDFTNCNWGVYLQTNYDVIIGSSGNGCSFANIKDDVGTSTNGGVAVYASTSGITISGTKINYNTFGSTIDQYGVMFGGSSANADYSEIKNNTFTSVPTAIDVNSITNTLTIQSNSFTTCTLPLYIHGGTSDNLDIYVLSNNFVGTTNDYEIKTNANFSGFKLYEYMVDNGNAYTGTGDNNGIIAAIHATDNEIVSDGTYRAIRNKLTTARADAEAYLGGAPTVVRVYVPAGNTIENCNTTVTTAETINFVGGNKTTSKLEFISGELILNGTGYYNFSTLYFKGSQTTGVPAYLLDFTDGNSTIDNCNFNVVDGNPSYTGLYLGALSDVVTVTNCDFTGNIDFSIYIIPSTNANKVISCNNITTTSGFIGVIIDGPAQQYSTIVKNNTISGNTYGVYSTVNAATAAGVIKIGDTNEGNIFTLTTNTGVYVTGNTDEVVIKHNKFSISGAGLAIENATGTLPASFNYINGVSTISGVSSLISGAGINWAPVVTSGTDQSTDCGFQPDLTAIWAAVYTNASIAATHLTAGTNYYTTIQNALDGDALRYVNLWNSSFTENVTIDDAGQYPYIRPASELVGTCTVNGNFTLAADGASATPTTIDGLILTAATGIDAAFDIDYYNIKNCTFNNATRNISFQGDYDVTYFNITNNTFNTANIALYFANGNAAGSSSADEFTISGNTFNSGQYALLTSYALSGFNITGNTFKGNRIEFENGYSSVDFGFNSDNIITSNYFYADASDAFAGIYFVQDNNYAAGLIKKISITQNLFDANTYAGALGTSYNAIGIMDYAPAPGPFSITSLSNTSIKNNKFSNFTASHGYAVYCEGNLTTTIDMQDNYYGSNNGPRVSAPLPSWHAATGSNTAYANSYNWSSQLARIYYVGNYADFTWVNWWNDITGSTPGTYAGTSFYPVWNDDTTPEHYASFLYAVDGTNDAGSRFIWGNNATYTEETGIELDVNGVTTTNLTLAKYYGGGNVVIQPANTTRKLFRIGDNDFATTTNFLHLNLTNNDQNVNELIYLYQQTNVPNLTVDGCTFTKGSGTAAEYIYLYGGGAAPAASNLAGTYNFRNNNFSGSASNYYIIGYTFNNVAVININNNTFTGPDNTAFASVFIDNVVNKFNTTASFYNNICTGYNTNAGFRWLAQVNAYGNTSTDFYVGLNLNEISNSDVYDNHFYGNTSQLDEFAIYNWNWTGNSAIDIYNNEIGTALAPVNMGINLTTYDSDNITANIYGNTIYTTNGNTNNNAIKTDSPSNLNQANIAIYYNNIYGASTNNDALIYLTHASNVVGTINIYENTLTASGVSNSAKGLKVNNTLNNTLNFYDNTVTNTSYFIDAYYTASPILGNWSIYNNTMNSNLVDYGIRLDRLTGNLLINNNTVINSGASLATSGVRVHNAITGTFDANYNTITKFTNGIYTSNISSTANIGDNIIDATATASLGIFINTIGGLTTIQRNTVTKYDNGVYTNGSTGGATNVNDNAIVSSGISGNNGISIGANTGAVNVLRNVVTDYSYVLFLGAGSSTYTIDDNSLTGLGVGSVGINNYGTIVGNVEIYRNTMSSVYWGVYTTVNHGGNWDVSFNDVTGSSITAGIYIAGALTGTATVYLNDITDNAGANGTTGILVPATAGTSITYNNITNCNTGITSAGTSSNNLVISYNEIDCSSANNGTTAIATSNNVFGTATVNYNDITYYTNVINFGNNVGSNFTADRNTATSDAAIDKGIRVNGTIGGTATMQNNTITTSASFSGSGIWLNGNVTGLITVDRNDFTANTTRARNDNMAFFTNGTTGAATITNNLFQGFDNGVQVGFTGTGNWLIDNNEFYFFANTKAASDEAIWFGNSHTGNITITNNIVDAKPTTSNSYSRGIFIEGVQTGNVTITDNDLFGSGTVGEGLRINGDINDGGVGTNKFYRNNVNYFADGIYFESVQTDTWEFYDASFVGNNLDLNTNGFNNTIATNFDGRFQYWGSNNGPICASIGGDAFYNAYNFGTQGVNLLNNASGRVTYWPWKRTDKTGTPFAPIYDDVSAGLAKWHPNFKNAFASLTGAATNIYVASDYTSGSTFTESVGYAGNAVGVFVEGRLISDYDYWYTNPMYNEKSWIDYSTGNKAHAPTWTVPSGETYNVQITGNYLTLQGFDFINTTASSKIINVTSAATNTHIFNSEFAKGSDLGNIIYANDNITLDGSIQYSLVTYDITNTTTPWLYLTRSLTFNIANNTITNTFANFALIANDIDWLSVQQNNLSTGNNTSAALAFSTSGVGQLLAASIAENYFTGINAIYFTGSGYYSGVSINNNSFEVVNNITATQGWGIYAESSVDGYCNWWGDNKGPEVASNPMGTEAKASSFVSYDKSTTGEGSWLTSELPGLFDAPCEGHWVYSVAESRLPKSDVSVQYFTSIQKAIDNSTTQDYIYVSDDYTIDDEDLTVFSRDVFLGRETPGDSVYFDFLIVENNSLMVQEDDFYSTDYIRISNNSEFRLDGYTTTNESYFFLAGLSNTLDNSNGGDLYTDQIILADNSTVLNDNNGNINTVTDVKFTGKESIITMTSGVLSIGRDLYLVGGETGVWPNNNIIDLSTEGNLHLYGSLLDGWSPSSYSYVKAYGNGYYYQHNMLTSTEYRIPVGNASYSTPIYLSETSNKWTALNKQTVKVKVNLVSPVTNKGVGDMQYDLHNLWTIKQEGSGITGQLTSLTFWTNNLVTNTAYDANYFASYPNNTFGAYWNGSSWTSHRPNSSWSVSGYTAINSIPLADMITERDWAIFTRINGSDATLTTSPSAQARSIIFTSKGTESVDLWWIRGDGDKSTVIVKPSASISNAITNATFINDVPVDGYDPNATGIFGTSPLADSTSGTTARVVYNGTSNTATITGLTSGQYYTFLILTSNGTGSYRNYLHRGLWNGSIPSALEAGSDEYYAGATSNTNNERTTMTKPRVTMSFNSTNVTAASGTMSDLYHANWCLPNNASYPYSLNNIMKYEMTGNIGSPVVGWKIRYTKLGYGTTTLTPYPTLSPSNKTMQITASTDYVTDYNIVSAIDGVGSLCEINNLDIFTVTANTQPKVTAGTLSNTASSAICQGDPIVIGTAGLTVTGYPTPSVIDWEISSNNSTWTSLGVAGATLTKTADYAADNGMYFRAIYSNGTACGALATVATASTQTFVKDNVDITDNGNVNSPAVCSGTAATFTSDIANLVHVPASYSDEYEITYNLATTTGLISALPTVQTAGVWYEAATHQLHYYIPSTSVATDNGQSIVFKYRHQGCGTFLDIATNTGTITVTEQPTYTSAGSWSNSLCANSSSTSANITATGTNINTATWQYFNGSWQTITLTGSADVNGYYTVAGFGKAKITTTSTTSVLTVSNVSIVGTIDFQVNFVNIGCETGYNNVADLTVTSSFAMTAPSNSSVCIGTNSIFTTGGATSYKWQYSTDDITYSDITIADAAWASGYTTATLTIDNTTTGRDGYYFKALGTTGGCIDIESLPAQLKVYDFGTKTNPSNITVCENTAGVTFTAGVPSANYTTSVKWEYNDGSGWVDVDGINVPSTGYTTDVLTITNATLAMYLYQFRAVYTFVDEPLLCNGTTDAATLGVDEDVTITSNPSNASKCVADNVTYTVGTSGATPVYVWEYNDGSGWTTLTNGALLTATVTNATTSSVTITSLPLALDGYEFRAVVDNGVCDSHTSDVATLDVYGMTVTTNPASDVVCEDAENIYFNSAVNSNGDPVSVIWQYKAPAGSFTNFTGAEAWASDWTTATLKVNTAPYFINGYQFQAVYTFDSNPALCPATTSAATITVNQKPTILTAVASQNVCTAGTTSFTVGVGVGYPQWYVSTNNVTWFLLSNGSSFGNPTVTNATTSTITLANVPTGWNNYYIQARVYNGVCTAVTSTAQIHVYDLAVTTNPSSGDVCQNSGTSLTAANSINGGYPVTVQWYSSTNSGGTWVSIPLATSTTLTLTNMQPTYPNPQMQYHAVFSSGPCTATTTAATVTVHNTPVAPASLTWTAATSSTLSFTWNDGTAYETPSSFNYELYNGASLITSGVLAGGESSSHSFSALTRGTTYTVRVRANYATCGASGWSSTTGTTLDPTITTTGTLANFGHVFIGSNSGSQTYTVAASQLDFNTLTITAPADFEVSLNGSTWSSSVSPVIATFSATTGYSLASTTIYARFSPVGTCGDKSGNITNVSTNATTKNVAAAGTALNVAPTVQVTDIDYTSDASGTISGTLVRGNGDGYILVMYNPANLPVVYTNPTLEHTYIVGESVGSGTVVAVGTSTSFTVNSVPSGDIWFRAFEYKDCSGSLPIYSTSTNTNNPQQVKHFVTTTLNAAQVNDYDQAVVLSGTVDIDIIPTDRTNNLITSNYGTVGFTFVKSDVNTTMTTTPGSPYSITASLDPDLVLAVNLSSTHGNPAEYYTVTRTSGTLGWLPSTSNTFKLYPKTPVNQDRIISYGTTTSTSMVVNWFKGANSPTSYSLLLMRQGAAPLLSALVLPRGTTFTTNSVFTAAPTAGTTNGKAMYYNSGSTVTVTGLTCNTQYYARVIAAYGGTASNTNAVSTFNYSTASLNPNSRSTGSCKAIEAGLSTIVEGYNAKSYNGKVYTNWNTVSEYLNEGFELYRLDVDSEIPVYMNVGSYSNDASLVGLHNSTKGKVYNFVDETAENGKTYLYKLISFSVDGEQYEHGTVEVTINNDNVSLGELTISDITPNPVTENAKITFTLTDKQNVTIEVVDLAGRTISVPFNNASFNAGVNSVSLELGDIVSGTYTVVVRSGDKAVAKRFVVVK